MVCSHPSCRSRSSIRYNPDGRNAGTSFADGITVTIITDAPESACALANNLTEDIRLVLGDTGLSLGNEKRKNVLIIPRFLPSAIFLREDGLRYPSTALRPQRRYTFEAERGDTFGDFDPAGPLARQSSWGAFFLGTGPSWRPCWSGETTMGARNCGSQNRL